MSTNTIKGRYKHAMNTEAEWINSDPVLLNGEIVVISDKQGMTKTGNGTSKWSELAYNAAGTLYGLNASITELNHVKGVTSSIQTQLNNKAALSHTHSYLPLSGGTMTGNIAYTLYSSTQTPLKVYGGDANGQGISVGAGGATIIGAGESAKACESLLSATNEELWLTSDNGIKFYVACQTIDNKLLVNLDATRQFYPATTNTGSIGTSSHKWANVYATTLHGALDGTIKSTSTAPTADTTYYIDMHSGNSTAQKTLCHNGYFRHNFRKGTAEITDDEGTVTTAAVTGYNKLILGSNINAGTDNNAYGALRLYSTNTGYTELRYNASTGNVTHYLPTAGGTLAVFSTARVTGQVVITDGTTGKIKSSGYTIDSSVPSDAVFTDIKVTQTAVTASNHTNYRPLLFGSSNSSTEGFIPATVTDQIYAASNMYVQPSTGTIVATIFKGTFSGNASSSTYSTNVRLTATNPATATTYYLPFISGITANANYILRGNNGIEYYTLEGTTAANGYGILYLGNGMATGTAANKYGAIRLYSTNTGYGTIIQANTATSITHTLPDTSGVVLNTGTTSFTQSLTSGTAIGTLKINGASKTLYAPASAEPITTAEIDAVFQ